MPIEPVFPETPHIVARLKSLDTTHRVITTRRLNEELAAEPDAVHLISDQIRDAVAYTMDRLPENPTPRETDRALGSLARDVDHGGKLYATLTRALDISRPADADRPLPALPKQRQSLATSPIHTRRQATITAEAQKAIQAALQDFREGIVAQPYRIHGNDLRDPRFLGDVRGRQDVYDVLDRAAKRLREVQIKTEAHKDGLHDDGSTEITPEQHAVLRETARGFVTDLVRESQATLRGAGTLEKRNELLAHHVDCAISELDIDKEPMRFATSWTSEAHYPKAHRKIRSLSAFAHEDVQALDRYRSITDLALLKELRARAYPITNTQEELRERIQYVRVNHRILQHPLGRTGLAAMAVLLRSHPHLYPIAALRPGIASRWFLPASALAISKVGSFVRRLETGILRIHALESSPKPQSKARILYSAVRKREGLLNA